MAAVGFDSDDEDESEEETTQIWSTAISQPKANGGQQRSQQSKKRNLSELMNDDNIILMGQRKSDKKQSTSDTPHQTIKVLQSLPKSKHTNWITYPTVTGMSGSVSVGCRLDLKEVAFNLPNTEYNPAGDVVAARVQLRSPAMVCNVFKTGTISTIGAKSTIAMLLAFRKIAKKLHNKCGYSQVTTITPIKVGSVSGKGLLPFGVDLVALEEAHSAKADYNPDFNASYLSWRDPIIHTKGACHIYHGGMVVILGCAAIPEIAQWFDDINTICRPFAKESTKRQPTLDMDTDMDNDTIKYRTSKKKKKKVSSISTQPMSVPMSQPPPLQQPPPFASYYGNGYPYPHPSHTNQPSYAAPPPGGQPQPPPHPYGNRYPPAPPPNYGGTAYPYNQSYASYGYAPPHASGHPPTAALSTAPPIQYGVAPPISFPAPPKK